MKVNMILSLNDEFKSFFLKRCILFTFFNEIFHLNIKAVFADQNIIHKSNTTSKRQVEIFGVVFPVRRFLNILVE